MVEDEEWTAGVVMHHIARGHRQMVDWIGPVRRGHEIAKTAEIDADNAHHAPRVLPWRSFAGSARYPRRLRARQRDGSDSRAAGAGSGSSLSDAPGRRPNRGPTADK